MAGATHPLPKDALSYQGFLGLSHKRRTTHIQISSPSCSERETKDRRIIKTRKRNKTPQGERAKEADRRTYGSWQPQMIGCHPIHRVPLSRTEKESPQISDAATLEAVGQTDNQLERKETSEQENTPSTASPSLGPSNHPVLNPPGA